MTTTTARLAAVALLSMCFAGTALAQTAAPAAKSETGAMTEKKAPKQRSAESLECSKEADAKGLHGKARKKFRSDCIRNAKAGGTAPSK